jgi:hypothetical protein
MSFWNRLFATLKSWPKAGDEEAESRSWMVKCPCGLERSVWELGGVRYGASSRGKRLLRRCSQCGRFRWHSVYKKEAVETERSAVR